MNGYELVRKQASQDSAINARVQKTGDSMTGNLTMTNNAKLIGDVQGNATTATTATKVGKSLILNVGGVQAPFNGQSQVEVYVAAQVHNHSSDLINKMTGYTKVSSSASIAATDTLNSAIGKLEYRVDSKASLNHTHNYAGSATSGGSANSAVKLQTARNINGVSFDGTKNITVADNTKLPLTGGTVTGKITCQNLDTVQKISCTELAANGTVALSMQIKSIYDGTPNRLSLRGATNENQARIKLGNGAEIYSGAGESKLMVDGGLYTNKYVEGEQIRSSGPMFPTLSAHGGWDCGLITNRFYTVYCVNVNQSSDRNLKKDIHYLDDANSLSKDTKSQTPFKNFVKEQLKIATYKYKRQEITKNEDGTETRTEMPNEEVDSQIGFIAQDIRNTEVGSLFVYGEDGNMSYSPSGFTAVIAKALQEEIATRDAQIAELSKQINSLTQEIKLLQVTKINNEPIYHYY